jgi:integrase/recombinase XerD
MITGETALTDVTSSDNDLIDLWLRGRSAHTQRADVARFRATLDKSLAQVTLGNLQTYADSLAILAPTGQCRILSAVKSLLAFDHRLGLLPMDVSTALKLPSVKNSIALRILPEADVQQLIAGETNRLNRVLPRLLNGGALRVSEICKLTWQDVQERGDAGQVTVYGKGGKTRVVLLSMTIWRELLILRDASVDGPVFRSRTKGGHLDPAQVRKIVGAVAERAEIAAKVSPHWLRHASAATTGRYLRARPTDSSARYLAV